MKKYSYGDWLKAFNKYGFKILYAAYQRGYMSRRTDPDEYLKGQVIRCTKDGRQYVLIPAWNTTRYIVRIYLYQ